MTNILERERIFFCYFLSLFIVTINQPCEEKLRGPRRREGSVRRGGQVAWRGEGGHGRRRGGTGVQGCCPDRVAC